MRAMLGTTDIRPNLQTLSPDSSPIRRVPPEAHPTLPRFVAVEAELVEGVGYPDVEPAGTDLIRFRTYGNVTPLQQLVGADGRPLLPGAVIPDVEGLAKVRLVYRVPDHNTQVPDGAVDQLSLQQPARQVNVQARVPGDGLPVAFGPAAELMRYVSRTIRPNVEATQIGGSLFYFTGPPYGGGFGAIPGQNLLPIGNETPAKILPFAEIRITWRRVPDAAGKPLNALGVDFQTLLGRVNRNLFDLDRVDAESDVFISSIGRPYKMGSLLYLGCEQSEPWDYIGNLSAGLLTDWTFIFAYRPQGWNFVYRRQGSASGFQLAARVSPPTVAQATTLNLPTAADQVLAQPPDDGITPYNWGLFNNLFRLGFA